MTLKIAGGEHRGRKIEAVPGDTTRPTSGVVREALFSIAGPRQSVLDCFSGTGAIALEALSRGALRAVAIERNPRAAAVIRANARKLGVEARLELIQADAFAALARLGPQTFELLFADPPYAFSDWDRLVALLAAHVAPGGLLVLEHSGDPPLPSFEVEARVYRYGGTRLTALRPAGAG